MGTSDRYTPENHGGVLTVGKNGIPYFYPKLSFEHTDLYE
jgi:hypothetical protein